MCQPGYLCCPSVAACPPQSRPVVSRELATKAWCESASGARHNRVGCQIIVHTLPRNLTARGAGPSGR